MFQEPAADHATGSPQITPVSHEQAEPVYGHRAETVTVVDGEAKAPKANMTPGQKRFYASEQSRDARAALQELVDNPQYNTDSDYYSQNDRGFVDRHLHFLSTHPSTNVPGYISNLKLMTNVKTR
jgi:hypothetical protein